MEIQQILAQGLILLKRPEFGDERGFFQKSFSAESLHPVWGERKVEQVNRSFSAKTGTFRGFHLQLPPFADAKMIQCLRGRALDYAVDIRLGSPTFLQTFSYELSPKNNHIAFLAEGFAHGFQTLEPDTELLYIHSARYEVKSEFGLNYQDPRLSVRLPLPIASVSARDQQHLLLPLDFMGIQF